MLRIKKTVKYSRYFLALAVASALSVVFSVFGRGNNAQEAGFSYVSPQETHIAHADVIADSDGGDDSAGGAGNDAGDDGDCDEGGGDCD